MKSISAIIAIILILMIVVALAALVWLWLSGLFTSVTTTGTSAINQTVVSLSSCMKIDTVSQNRVYLRNCGQGVITNNSLNIYIDDISFGFNMTPSSINQGELATIKLPIWGISIGLHNLKITNPYTQLIKQVESVLHDSAVLALDFDEGSGNYTYDKSPFNNNGKLCNYTSGYCEICNGGYCPTWVIGKFGKAIQFDGNDYVNVSYSSSLNITDKITIEVWIKFATIHSTSGPYPRILMKYIDFSNRINLVFDNSSKQIGWSFKKYDVTYPTYGNKNDWNTDQWYHIVGSYDKDIGINNMKIYFNGQLDNQVTQNMGTIPTASADLTIGAYPWEGFEGIVDSVRIYNKALTPDETVILKMR